MSRKHNTRHPDRGRSTYAKKNKRANADRYGIYRDGVQVAADRLAKRTGDGPTRD
jgi:hypothetical protein